MTTRMTDSCRVGRSRPMALRIIVLSDAKAKKKKHTKGNDARGPSLKSRIKTISESEGGKGRGDLGGKSRELGQWERTFSHEDIL